MSLKDTTLLQVIDNTHINELKTSWATWNQFKPEITSLPLLLVYDAEIESRLKEISHIIDRPNVTLQKFTNKIYYKSQRDAMLTSFFEGTSNIKTKNYLKLDTDCVALNDDKSWLTEVSDIDNYVFIAKGWSVARKDYLDIMETWCDSIDELRDKPRITNYSMKECGKKLKIKRITSWFYLGNVEWNNKWTNLCKIDNHFELPICSHDSFLWHVAERGQFKYKRVNMKNYGFDHRRM
jgi:hypothetical protein